MINLNESQKAAVIRWVADGRKIAEVQNLLAAEFGLRLTYMEVRFLVDDLKLMPKDAEPAKSNAASLLASPAAAQAAAAAPEPEEALAPEPPPATPAPAGKVSVTVDQIARPGAMVSGTATFSDGQSATWFVDEYGRLALATAQKGYRPPPADVQVFQMELQKALQKLGMA